MTQHGRGRTSNPNIAETLRMSASHMVKKDKGWRVASALMLEAADEIDDLTKENKSRLSNEDAIAKVKNLIDQELVMVIAKRDRLAKRVEKLEEALREIIKGEGRFSIDPLEHASNTIEDMKGLARRDLGDDAAREVRDGGG